MELKPYQQTVIDDIAVYLDKVQQAKDEREAYRLFWTEHPRTPVQPFPGTAVEPYKNNVSGVPHICVKVPTAGGKTFIACNALNTVFGAFANDKPKAVVWLVPSITILDQTIKALRDPSHPYRQRLNTHFRNRVEVYDKAALLQGGSFNATSVKEQLSIMVFSFDSLRARNKEDRKVFQENGNLQTFEHLLPNGAELTLGAVIKHLNPVVVVDESHNAESELSVEMLKEINPCFILDLTATPRANSNIISFVDAWALKTEKMIKLPVIVYNHQDKTEVVLSALQMQRRLEAQAMQEEKAGGHYIRPIVLFQVQPKNGKDFTDNEEEKTNVQRLKEKLMELRIPEAQIKIKTANMNEIKNEELMSRESEVRFIITINALKEGWDCPFAYVLASLADRSSAVDVEQILGRVLRQPYVMKHQSELLNLSYVLTSTATAKFMQTLQNIVKGLNKAGFTAQDVKLPNEAIIEQAKEAEAFQQLSVFANGNQAATEDVAADIDTARLLEADTSQPSEAVLQIEQLAIKQNEAFESTALEMETTYGTAIPTEIKSLVKTYPIKEIFKEQAQTIKLPQFFVKVPASQFNFGEEYHDEPLEKETLLKGFALSKGDTNIAFDSIETDLYKVDLDETKKEHLPTFVRIDGALKESLLAYILDPSRKGSRVKNLTRRIMETIGNMYPIPDPEIEKYIARILDSFTDEQFNDFSNNEYTYTDKIKQKIRALSEAHAEKKFKEFLDKDKVFTKHAFSLPPTIAPGETAKDITKSLYEKEGKMNGFEERVINEIGNSSNIVFWTRNIERRGFRINGFINHYPDFIIQTKSGKTVVLETKGDHLDAEQKIRLGNLWASKAGNNYRYFIVYERRTVDGAYKLEDFMDIIRSI